MLFVSGSCSFDFSKLSHNSLIVSQTILFSWIGILFLRNLQQSSTALLLTLSNFLKCNLSLTIIFPI